MGNRFKTTLLLVVMTVLIVGIGRLFGGREGMILAFFLAVAMNFFSYWFSDRIVLRMYRAKEAGPEDYPQLYDTVRGIVGRAGLPMPRIAVIPQRAPNAFATGRSPAHAVVAVTEGLLELMGPEEVKGVLAHEIAHVKNRDILIGSIAATMAGAIMILANMMRWSAFLGGGSDEEEGGGPGALGLLAMSILAPIAAMLIQMAISRSREYQADATGASFAGDPEGLAKALEKLGAFARRIPLPAQANTAHMFIVNPLGGGRLAGLFSTHPPLEERIARLRRQGGRPDSLAEDGEAGRRAAESTWKHLSG